ncbi:MAG: hypothetical protein KKH98_10725, partial [Spirochaetes bacterium]|nr:hypothetical protein [Spirochaetota bacterium]
VLTKDKQKREEKERAEEEKLKNKNIHEDHFFSELKKIEKKNTAEKLSEAIHLLKDYFEKKFNGHFKDKSSKEILDHFLKNNLIEKNLIEQLQNILNESDVLKFSSGDPDPKKAEQLLKNIKGIVYSILGRKSK